MCLGIPAKVVKIEENGMFATVDAEGVETRIAIGLLTDVKPGDYVMIHAGYAVEKVDQDEAKERLRIWEELLAYEEDAGNSGN